MHTGDHAELIVCQFERIETLDAPRNYAKLPDRPPAHAPMNPASSAKRYDTHPDGTMRTGCGLVALQLFVDDQNFAAHSQRVVAPFKLCHHVSHIPLGIGNVEMPAILAVLTLCVPQDLHVLPKSCVVIPLVQERASELPERGNIAVGPCQLV